MTTPTVLAAGINAALGTVDPQDSWQQHYADTLREGYFLADPRVVELLAREAPAAVLELADWGRRSRACPTAAWTSGSSAPTGGGGPAMPATGPAGRSCAL